MDERIPTHHRAVRRPGRWPVRAIAGLVALLGLVLAAGGALLVARGGSWYYLPAGVALVVAGVLLWRGRTAGAGWYGGVLGATVLWTLWEAGLDYWAWVPRVGLLLILGCAVALVLPRLDRPASRRLSRSLAGAGVVALLVALAVPFLLFGPSAPADGARVSSAGAAGAAGLAPAPSGSIPSAASTAAPTATSTAASTVSPTTPSPSTSITPTTSTSTSTATTAATAATGWPTYGGSSAALRYSALREIDRSNVAGLRRAWVYRTGDLPERLWGAETTPIEIGDSLFLCSARNIVIALDAKSGAERWRFDPKVSDASIPYTAACRGVSYYAAPGASGACATRIIEGTLDGRLVAVDAQTGKPCEGFGEHGQVSITRGMGEAPPGYVSINSAPTIVRGVVVTGHQVLDGQKRYEPSGVILGYDAVSGALRWAWDVMRPDLTGLPPAGQEFTRGTPNMWTTASGDEQLGLVYLPMGNSTADYWSGLRRPQEFDVSASLVALDASTGKPAWRFQTVHHDVWDYDLGSQPSLIDFPTAAGPVPALVLASKQGEIFVLDRRTGQPLTPVEERPAPGGGVEPELRAPTQPYSTYHSLKRPALRERDMWGISPIDQLVCRIEFRGAAYQGPFTPPTADRPFIEYPGYNGGSDWGSVAIDPVRGVIVANYNDMPNYDRLVPRAEVERQGWKVRGDGAPGPDSNETKDPQVGTPYGVHVNAGWRLHGTGMMCKEPPYGGIRAIDLASGKTVWDRPLGQARENGPFGIPSKLPIEIGTPNNGGPAVTAGGLIFIAAATDNLIRAIDIETGRTVWSDVLPAGGQATPMVYEAGGREYLVIVAAGHHFMETPRGDYVVAYALPDAARSAMGVRSSSLAAR